MRGRTKSDHFMRRKSRRIFFSNYENILGKFYENFDWSGITPSYFSRSHEMVTFGPTPHFLALLKMVGGKKTIIWAINLCTNLLQNLEMHKMGFTKLLCNNIVWQILDVCNRNNNKKYSRPKTSFLIENVEIERQTSRQSVAQSLEQIRSHKKCLKIYEVVSNRLQILKRSSIRTFILKSFLQDCVIAILTYFQNH